MTETEKLARLKRMREIVELMRDFRNRDADLVRELIWLATAPEFTGMDKRRSQLSYCLAKTDSVKMPFAKNKWWSEIHSLISDFTSEIAQYREGNLSGGDGHQ